jgi:amidohydrolase
MNLEQKIANILTDQMVQEIILIRRQFHQYPELSFQEHHTSRVIRELLDQWKIEYTFPHVGTGIVARIRGDRPGKRIALRSDMDALPITEQTDLPFSSENPGIMHACGHDVHMASLLGVIRVLNHLKQEIKGEVLFLFQPGEELIPGGARLMMEEGIFNEREPDLIIAQHVLPEMEAGHVGFRPGIYMASSDEIYITVKGKGGHGALRQQVRDPILMASHILISLQDMVNRKAPENIPTVLSFGKVVADGAVNVIPDDVFLEGTFRTMNENWRKEAHLLIQKVCEDITSAMGGSAKVEIRSGYPVLHNNEQIARESKKLATKLLGKRSVEDMDIRMTAEDFAWFTQKIPGMMYRLGVKDPGSDKPSPLHSPFFKVNETALRTGISVMAYLAIELLKMTPVENKNPA